MPPTRAAPGIVGRGDPRGAVVVDDADDQQQRQIAIVPRRVEDARGDEQDALFRLVPGRKRRATARTTARNTKNRGLEKIMRSGDGGAREYGRIHLPRCNAVRSRTNVSTRCLGRRDCGGLCGGGMHDAVRVPAGHVKRSRRQRFQGRSRRRRLPHRQQPGVSRTAHRAEGSRTVTASPSSAIPFRGDRDSGSANVSRICSTRSWAPATRY